MEFVNTKPIRLIELFGGIGSQSVALKRLGVDFEQYRLVEFDKFPIASYNAIHGTNFVPTDITKISGKDLGIVDTDHFTYLLTYSFPCQDLSVAGKMKGMDKGSGTRSGLLWEVERLLKETDYLPQLLLMENVPQVHGKKNRAAFEQWISFLESKGYSNHWKDLNAKDYGVAQNRPRTFMVSILGDYTYTFPEPFPLQKTIKDYLEDEVEEKYYLTGEKVDRLIAQLVDGFTFEREACDLTVNNPRIIATSNCLKARYDNGISNFRADGVGIVERVNVIGRMDGYESINRVYDCNGLSPTISTCQGGNQQPKILTTNTESGNRGGLKLLGKMAGYEVSNRVYSTCGSSPLIRTCSDPPKILTAKIRQATKEGTIDCNVGGVFDSSFPSSTTRRGRVQNSGEVSPTITAAGCSDLCRVESQYRIRKLTPRECWRLMGFRDDDFNKAAAVNSNAQLYKQAGNAIVVDVLESVFSNLLANGQIIKIQRRKERMELRDTVEMMLSADYKERFRGEYLQAKIRRDKLEAMLVKMEARTLTFTPTCSMELLKQQKSYLDNYIHVLRVRAEIEGVELEVA